MRKELFESVAKVINTNCYWAKITCLRSHMYYYTKSAGHVGHTTCLCMTLEASHSHGQYLQGQQWQIPEPELDRVLSEMCSEDKALQQRCRQLELTPEDVDTLVNRATYGVICLDMSDIDDFIPPAFIPR